MKIFSLTYVSSTGNLYSHEAYKNIALDSVKNNERRNITGILLVYQDTIIQFLEGPEVEVRQLYHRIEQDPRHKGPTVMSARSLKVREFPDWTMGFKVLTEITDPNFMFHLDPHSLTSRFPRRVSKTTEALLEGFKRSSKISSGISSVSDG